MLRAQDVECEDQELPLLSKSTSVWARGRVSDAKNRKVFHDDVTPLAPSISGAAASVDKSNVLLARRLDERRGTKRAAEIANDKAFSRLKQEPIETGEMISDDQPNPVSSGCDMMAWSVDEMHEFETDAMKLICDVDMAKMEAKTCQALLERIPKDLRLHYGLPGDNADYGVVIANGEETEKLVIEMIKDVKIAYLKHVTSLVTKPTAKFQLDACFEHGGILRILVTSETFWEVKDDVLAAIAAMDGASGQEKDMKQVELDNMELDVLKHQICEYGVATHLWESSIAFATAYHRKEPNREQVKEYLDDLDSDLRTALNISPKSKYNMRIKPKEWRSDVQAVFNVSYRMYLAHHSEEITM